MTWLQRLKAMFLDTKSIKDLKSQQADLKIMVALAKSDERIEVGKLRHTLHEARTKPKYVPSPLASSFNWRNHD